MKNRKFWICALLAVISFGLMAAGSTEATDGATKALFQPEELPLTEKMTLLALQIGLILFAAKLGGMLASLFKLPSVLGELGAGVVIGPWALGGIGFGSGLFKFGLFRGGELAAQAAATGNVPFAVTPELYGICTIASVILLFMSGIETDLKMFLRFAFAGSLVGIGGVVFSFLFGDFCAIYAVKVFPDLLGNIACLKELGDMVSSGQIMRAILSPAAMFMGIMSTATSVGITARILSERRKMDSEEGVTIMAGAVIDDVLGIIVLAIGMGIIGSQQANAAAQETAKAGIPWGNIGMTALKAIGIWLGGTMLGIVFARKISFLLKMFRSPVAIGTLAFGLSLVIAGLFEALGLTLIIGAYVIGLALSKTDIKHMIQENLESVYTFLVPVFFCVMGMMVDCNALCSKPVLIFGGIYTILAVFAKVLGCAIPSYFCGFNILGSLRVGSGMIPRGEVALIIAGIGLSNGFLTQEVFGIGIMMTLITTIIAPPCLVALFNTRKSGVRGRRKANTEGSSPFSFTLPNIWTAKLMLDRLINTFRHEGFYTYCLNARENIWEVVMNDIEISIKREEDKICFESTPNEEALITSAWMEAAGEINELANAISKPIRNKEIGDILKNEASEMMQQNTSARHIQQFVMIPNFTAASKVDAINKLIDKINENRPGMISDVEKVRKAVFAREESMPTGLNNGIAVPHGRTDAVKEIIGAVAIVDNSSNDNGIIPDYETIDHSAIQIIVLTLAPTSGQAPYLQLMASITTKLKCKNGHEQLLECKTPEQMKNFFKQK